MSKRKNGKNKDAKRGRREPDEAERQAHEALERRRRLMRAANIGIPLVTLVAAATTYLVTDSQGTAAFVGLIGVGIWMPVLLGGLGGSVPPRDRNRAGSIDFGQRR